MKRKIELLAPAGDGDSLRAAVENGADAVYLGGKLFNARQNAGNFDMQQLKDALYYAHVRGVNIYLAMNTLVSDSEMEQAVNYAGDAFLMGIDGIIVQDIGFAGLLKKAVPGVSLHASTQMTIYNPEGIKILEGMGFKRAVLAREVSLSGIREIAASTSLEIEIFIHGALCISYSGQCLMSSIIGGRSGNRGKCAQPCRLPYRLVCEGLNDRKNIGDIPQYLLSPKDLCSLQYLGDIVVSGAASLKIEGRMKSPEYVATVVRIYRKYLDIVLESGKSTTDNALKPEERDLLDLAQIFNRGGFSGGYLNGKTGKDMMCFEKPKNWGTYLGTVISYDSFEETVKVKLDNELSIGDGIEIWNGEEESPGNIVTSINIDGRNVKIAGKGDTAAIGRVRGKILKECRVYKTSDKALMVSARETFGGKPLKRVKLKGKAILKTGSPFILKVYDYNGNESEARSSILPEKAVNRPLTAGRIAEQLGKTGQTTFDFSELEIEQDENLSLPVSEINDVRRKALEDMEQKRAAQKQRDGSLVKKQRDGSLKQRDGSLVKEKQRDGSLVKKQGRFSCIKSGSPCFLSLYFYKWDSSVDYAMFKADRVYLPLNALFDGKFGGISDNCRKKGLEIFIWLPSITRGNYDRLIKKHISCETAGMIDGILAGNPGTVEMLRNLKGVRITGDHALNIFNRLSLEEAALMGLEAAALSTELTLEQMSGICRNSPIVTEAAVYGRLPLMTTEYCPAGCVKGGLSFKTACSCICKTASFRLKDRTGTEFPVISDNIDCRSTILNSNVLFIPDTLKKLKECGLDIFRLYIWDEKPEIISKLVDLHRNMAGGGYVPTPADKEFADRIRSGGFTKGHYYRGV